MRTLNEQRIFGDTKMSPDEVPTLCGEKLSECIRPPSCLKHNANGCSRSSQSVSDPVWRNVAWTCNCKRPEWRALERSGRLAMSLSLCTGRRPRPLPCSTMRVHERGALWHNDIWGRHHGARARDGGASPRDVWLWGHATIKGRVTFRPQV